MFKIIKRYFDNLREIKHIKIIENLEIDFDNNNIKYNKYEENITHYTINYLN